jgi:hypothetical protein
MHCWLWEIVKLRSDFNRHPHAQSILDSLPVCNQQKKSLQCALNRYKHC